MSKTEPTPTVTLMIRSGGHNSKVQAERDFYGFEQAYEEVFNWMANEDGNVYDSDRDVLVCDCNGDEVHVASGLASAEDLAELVDFHNCNPYMGWVDVKTDGVRGYEPKDPLDDGGTGYPD